MNICIVSRDAELLSLCREALAHRSDARVALALAEPKDGLPLADVYIWDLDETPGPPSALSGDGNRHILLGSRSQFRQYCGRLSAAAVAILLKPVNAATLRAFLEQPVQAVRTAGEQVRPVENREPSDRHDLLQYLLEANFRLQEYDRERTNFLARALHDFRTPMTALSGYCGLFLGGKLGPLDEHQADVVRRMQHSIQRLSRMATAMYQLSLGRNLRRPLELRETDIRTCIDQALYEIQPFARDKKLQIAVNVDAPTRPVYCEAEQIEQVLINLLENACKFTPVHGSIGIRGYPFFWERRSTHILAENFRSERRATHSQEPNAFRVDICDSGIGIAAEHLEKIFEEYTSHSGSRDRSAGGLGLAICSMIVAAHRGKVWAESSGEGATFSFVLPFLKPPQAEPELGSNGVPHSISVRFSRTLGGM